jgi:hypothetical protein
MMWSYNKNHWAFPGDVEGTSGTYLPEENAGDHAPKEKGGLVGHVGRKWERFYMVRHADDDESWGIAAVGLETTGQDAILGMLT